MLSLTGFAPNLKGGDFMQNYILGAAIFFFAASLALNVYSFSLLNRSIEVMRFALNVYSFSLLNRSIEVIRSFLHLIDKLNREADCNVRRREGTD